MAVLLIPQFSSANQLLNRVGCMTCVNLFLFTTTSTELEKVCRFELHAPLQMKSVALERDQELSILRKGCCSPGQNLQDTALEHEVRAMTSISALETEYLMKQGAVDQGLLALLLLTWSHHLTGWNKGDYDPNMLGLPVPQCRLSRREPSALTAACLGPSLSNRRWGQYEKC